MNREEMLQGLKDGKDPLELSIQKWQDIVKQIEDGILPDYCGVDRSNCALCEVYDIDDCARCPSYSCSKTPYHQFMLAMEAKDKVSMLTQARLELEYLKCLRPTVHKKDRWRNQNEKKKHL
jgi:hypothetical protein